MKRREFITLLGGAAAWPVGARAQQPKLRTIGFLGTGTPQTQGMWLASLVERLRELNWIDGRTVTIDVQWAAGRPERYAEIAAEFVRLKVDVIVTVGAVVPALKKATSVIPIIFVLDNDPVGSGLVASLARPGGNVTGLSTLQSDVAGKRLELLREVVPGFRRLAIMADVGWRGAVQELGEVQAAARTLGLDVVDTLEVRKPEDIAPAFGALKGDAQALYVCGGPLATASRLRIATFAMGARLPAIYPSRIYLEAGGFISYGVDNRDLFRRAGEFVDKILRGAKPSDLPVEQPTKFELVINLHTAGMFGLTVPPGLLAIADEVIE